MEALERVSQRASETPKLTTILYLSIALDKGARDLYQGFAKISEDEQLVQLWRSMAAEEAEHISYWEGLIKVASANKLPNVFDDPDRVIAELEAAAAEMERLRRTSEHPTVAEMFTMACRCEFFMIHPAFEALFHLMSLLDHKNEREQHYSEHINTFVDGLRAYANTPEHRLIADILIRNWRDNRNLAKQLSRMKSLSGILPICSGCKSIRSENNQWMRIEKYVSEHSETRFSHSLCPACAKEYYPALDLEGDSQ